MGDIGVAQSADQGASWEYLGIALDEPWHLSYPHVFEDEGTMYMLPEGHKSGRLRLYRATRFPLEWEYAGDAHPQPLVDASLARWEGRWWLLGTDSAQRGASRCRQLSAWHGPTVRGPWTPHAHNPVMRGDPGAGIRGGGRLVRHGEDLYRFGQSCARTYGEGLVAWRVDTLSPTDFRQTRVPLEFGRQLGRRHWNGARFHHLDAAPLADGSWVAVMDGDWQPAGAVSGRARSDAKLLALAYALAGLLILAARHRPADAQRVADALTKPCGSLAACAGGVLAAARGAGGAPRRRKLSASRAERERLPLRNNSARGASLSEPRAGRGGPAQAATQALRQLARGRHVALALCALTVALALAGTAAAWGATQYYRGTLSEAPAASAAARVAGQASRYTVNILSYSKRVPTLRRIMRHVARCPSVEEVVLRWSEREAPPVADWAEPGAAPLRLLPVDRNSLNSRFVPDPLLRTRAVLSLDDDILTGCADLEAAFALWRADPEALTGIFPRLVVEEPRPAYLGERAVFSTRTFNMLITGGLFFDHARYAPAYLSDKYKDERRFVDDKFNCEDILLNYVVAIELGKKGRKEPWVHLHVPRRRLDLSKLTIRSVGISSNTAEHQAERDACIARFNKNLGMHVPPTVDIPLNVSVPICVAGVGCIFL